MAASDVKYLELSTTVKKPVSITRMYLDPINVEPNVEASAKSSVVSKVMENVKTYEITNKPRSVTTMSKSSMIVADRDDVDKNICVLNSQVLGIEPKTVVVPDGSTSLAQPDNPAKTPLDKSDANRFTQSPEKLEEKDYSNGMSSFLANKEENSVEKKDQYINIVNIDDLDSDDEPIGKILAPGIAKRLKNRKGKGIESSNTPSKSLKRRTSVRPTKGGARKHSYGKKIPTNIHEVPIDNISFHSVENIEKWKFVYQRRMALERELGKDAFECKEVIGLIQEAGLMKSVSDFGKFYEMLVKEFIVNISKECDNKRSKEFRKVYVRGRCVGFSPEIINNFWAEMKKNKLRWKFLTMSFAEKLRKNK
ncbi:uncharacterized protein LOC127095145 [Lathyrus oleraceus]|uniref:uncharacterized protein LOC127095145 n=1 Tax=Pisum sativum TaxID=3888 RepID=UPI0021CDFECE|nr:uncharacterized protein LOC127095145 [Pisum sativum]